MFTQLHKHFKARERLTHFCTNSSIRFTWETEKDWLAIRVNILVKLTSCEGRVTLLTETGFFVFLQQHTHFHPSTLWSFVGFRNSMEVKVIHKWVHTVCSLLSWTLAISDTLLLQKSRKNPLTKIWSQSDGCQLLWSVLSTKRPGRAGVDILPYVCKYVDLQWVWSLSSSGLKMGREKNTFWSEVEDKVPAPVENSIPFPEPSIFHVVYQQGRKLRNLQER